MLNLMLPSLMGVFAVIGACSPNPWPVRLALLAVALAVPAAILTRPEETQ